MSRFASNALLCLYQHRLLTAEQLRRMLCPPSANPEPRYQLRELAALRRRGLADAVPRGRGHQLVWFATPAGAALAEHSGAVRPRNHRMSADRAAGPLQEHTLALNETGLAFMEAARRLGHECGPLDWIPEPAHHLNEAATRAGDILLPDALLSYVLVDPAARQRSHLQFFVEVDRGTMTVSRLAAKLAHYARYHDYTPPGQARSAAGSTQAWRTRYPRFPRILIVLTGRGETALRHRAGDLAAHVRQLPQLRRHRDRFAAGVTTLHLLQTSGPFEPIFMHLLADGHPAATALLSTTP